MFTHIGDKRLIHFYSFIIEDSIPIILMASAGGDTINIKLFFHPEDVEKPGVDWHPEDNYLRINFRGWKNSIGTATAKPVKLGTTTSGESLGFVACHWRIGNMNRLDLQLLLGGNYEQQ